MKPSVCGSIHEDASLQQMRYALRSHAKQQCSGEERHHPEEERDLFPGAYNLRRLPSCRQAGHTRRNLQPRRVRFVLPRYAKTGDIITFNLNFCTSLSRSFATNMSPEGALNLNASSARILSLSVCFFSRRSRRSMRESKNVSTVSGIFHELRSR